MLTTFKNDSDSLNMVITGDESWVYVCMTLKPKLNHPNGSVQKSQDRKKHFKFGQMWRYCSPWYPSSSHIDDCMWLFGQKQNCNHVWITVFTGLGLRWLFLFPKLKLSMKGKRFAAIGEIKEKSRPELLAIPKSSFHKCFKDWKKRWYKCIISEGGYFEWNKIVWLINK